MNKVFLYKIYAIIVACLISATTYATNHNLNNYFSESFKVEDSPSIIVKNKYGFVDCKLWNKDSVKVEVAINLEGDDLEDLEELMESIQPRFSSFNNIIELETNMEEPRLNIIDELFSILDIFSKKEMDINYTIYAPADASFDIKNKFGDVMLDNFTGQTRVKLSYGDFIADRISKEARLELSHGKMNTRYFESGELKLTHYKSKLRRVDKINLESLASEIQLGAVNYLSLKSNKDEVEIDSVGLLRGTAKLSDIEIYSLNETINMELENVNIDIKKINQDFEDFDINQSGSHIDVNVEGVSFYLDAELEGSKMSVPKSVYDIDKDMIDEKKNHRTIDLSFGESPNKTMKLKGKYGSITLLLISLL